MIEGGWDFVWAAYAIAFGALGVLAVVVLRACGRGRKRARELDKREA